MWFISVGVVFWFSCFALCFCLFGFVGLVVVTIRVGPFGVCMFSLRVLGLVLGLVCGWASGYVVFRVVAGWMCWYFCLVFLLLFEFVLLLLFWFAVIIMV